MRRGVFLGVSDAPTARGWAPRAPHFWGSLLFMHTPFNAELSNLTPGEGACFWGSAVADPQKQAPSPGGWLEWLSWKTRLRNGGWLISRGGWPHLKGTGSQRSPNLEVPLYLCVHHCRRTTKFDGVTCRGGTCILGSATPPIPTERISSAIQYLGFSCTFTPTSFNAERPNSAW